MRVFSLVIMLGVLWFFWFLWCYSGIVWRNGFVLV